MTRKKSKKPRTLDTELMSVGMRVFVDYFDLFWDYALDRVERQAVLAILMDNGLSDTVGGASWRASCGRNIFLQGWVEEALQRVMASKHILRHSPEIHDNAKKCLATYHGARRKGPAA